MMSEFRTLCAHFKLHLLTRGDALRSAQRLPLPIMFRAFGAGLPVYFLSKILNRSFAVFACTVG
jgi:hypothetical protein